MTSLTLHVQATGRSRGSTAAPRTAGRATSQVQCKHAVMWAHGMHIVQYRHVCCENMARIMRLHRPSALCNKSCVCTTYTCLQVYLSLSIQAAWTKSCASAAGCLLPIQHNFMSHRHIRAQDTEPRQEEGRCATQPCWESAGASQPRPTGARHIPDCGVCRFNDDDDDVVVVVVVVIEQTGPNIITFAAGGSQAARGGAVCFVSGWTMHQTWKFALN